MIRTEHLYKEFKTVIAVKNLNLDIEKGDVFGFIGPNGAGKTTTIKILATLMRPSAGKAYIDGIDVVAQPKDVRRLIGYMPDFFGVYDDMKVWEYLDFFAAAYRIVRNRRAAIIDEVLELTDLSVKREDMVDSLSRGMKQRLCLAKTLVHDPEVLLLDEPASGLDPRARIEMRELLKELQRMGKTILISSHILTELSDFCNKIGIVEKGELLISGDVEEIMLKLRGHQLFTIGLEADAEAAAELLAGIEGVISSIADDGQSLCVQAESHVLSPADLINALVHNNYRVTRCRRESANLEDIFMQITKGIVA